MTQAQAAGLDTYNSKDSGVVPIMTRDSEVALWLSIQLFDQGICAFPMLYPIVLVNKSRLRFSSIPTIQATDRHDNCLHRAKLARAPKSMGVI